MYETIILPLDPEDFAASAVHPANMMAAAFDASLVLVGESGVVERHRKDLGEMTEIAASPFYLAEDDDPVERLDRLATEHPRALMVMATHARGRLGYALFGSTAEEVLRTRSGPVLLVGPNMSDDWQPGSGPVAVALDGSDLSEQSLPFAVEWSSRFASALHLVNVGDADAVIISGGEPQPAATSGVISDVAASAPVVEPHLPQPVIEPVRAGETYLAGQANLLQVKGHDVTATALDGSDPAAAIIEHFESLQPDVVVMTTRARSGLERVIVGSTTMAVASEARCPVLAIPPAT